MIDLVKKVHSFLIFVKFHHTTFVCTFIFSISYKIRRLVNSEHGLLLFIICVGNALFLIQGIQFGFICINKTKVVL